MNTKSSLKGSTSHTQNRTSENEKKLHKERREQRRIRNIESAKRSRDRLKNETTWMEMQVQETNDRMRALERRVKDLTDELSTPSRTSRINSPDKLRRTMTFTPDRPKWFGEPF